MKNANANAPGKRPLYDPTLGASNHQRAREGRFSDHPVFSACKKLQGVGIALERIRGLKDQNQIGAILEATSGQFKQALSTLAIEAKALSSIGDKLKFAESFQAYFDPKQPDHKTDIACRLYIVHRTKNPTQELSQAEFRRLVREKTNLHFSDMEWKRFLKKTGLNEELPTHREKMRAEAS